MTEKMKIPSYLIRRPAKVKFRDSNVAQEGFILFMESKTDNWLESTKKTQFTFQFNDAQQTEKVFDFWNVDFITFL